jgi:hypothetical protein
VDERAMADLTLHDLLAWEPRLQLLRRPLSGAAGTRDPRDRDITWAVSARATPPMLSAMRGGELVLIPERIVTDSGVGLSVLLRELASHRAGAVVLERPPESASPLPVLITASATVELEGEVNRLLTERRGELYRSGTDLGRALSGVGGGADLATILATAGGFVRAPSAVLDRRGVVVEQSPGFRIPPGISPTALARTEQICWMGAALGSGASADGPAAGWLVAPLSVGGILCLGPVRDDQRALARLAVERVGLAVDERLQRVAESRPRGRARSSAVAAALTDSPDQAARSAAALGLPATGLYRVALSSPELTGQGLASLLAPLGTIHDAGEHVTADGSVDGLALCQVLVELAPDPGIGRSGRLTARAPRVRPAVGWVALSSPGSGTRSLPAVAREAHFVAALQRAGHINQPVAHFEALAETGAYRLLYGLWGAAGGSTALEGFARDALGELPANDRRGALRKTLLAYLSAGGSQVETATELAIHRNTLTYRLKQIAAYTGIDPTDPAMRLPLHLALLIETLPPREASGVRE